VDTCVGGGVIAGSIVKTAIGLAWPTGEHGKEKADATPAYRIAMPKYNGANSDDEWSDCGVFTSTVMIASQADTNYVKRGTGPQIEYVQNNPSKYTIIENVGDTSMLQPGDILIYNGSDGGHTFVYVGKQSGFNGDKADASWHSHVPQAGSAVSSFSYNGRGGQFIVARLK
jgi:cell wall-associated NlpC family hydrolase